LFRATSLLLTSLAVLCLFQTAFCQAPDPDEPHPIALYNSIPAPAPLSPARRWELSGRGDGVEHDFIYTSWANPGPFEITVASQSQKWMSNVTVTLEDATGSPLMRVQARAGADQTVRENVVYRLLSRQSVRIRVHVDDNTGAYSVLVNGPLER